MKLLIFVSLLFTVSSKFQNKWECAEGDCENGAGTKMWKDHGLEKGLWKNGKVFKGYWYGGYCDPLAEKLRLEEDH
jgi:hypothetical protein